jgi:hypothetical protein
VRFYVDRRTGELVSDSLHFVLLLAASNLPKPLFEHFVTQLESFLFYYIFTRTPTKELERNFSVWADELREIGYEKNKKSHKEKLNTFINIVSKRACQPSTLTSPTV